MNKEILEMLNRVVCHTTSEYEHKQEVIKMAKVLVERDTPKPIIFDGFNNPCCPICGEWGTYNKFCYKCGQRLDWRGDGE